MWTIAVFLGMFSWRHTLVWIFEQAHFSQWAFDLHCRLWLFLKEDTLNIYMFCSYIYIASSQAAVDLMMFSIHAQYDVCLLNLELVVRGAHRGLCVVDEDSSLIAHLVVCFLFLGCVRGLRGILHVYTSPFHLDTFPKDTHTHTHTH